MEKLRLNDASFFYEPETFDRAGFRFSLRLSRPAAHGDHPGAAGARVQSRTDHDRARRALPRDDNRRRGRRDRQAGKDARHRQHRQDRRAVHRGDDLTNDEYLGGILQLLEEKRGSAEEFEYITSDRVMLIYELPLNEIVLDFYDRLKSVSRGYASLDYHLAGYREAISSSSTFWSRASRSMRCR